MGNWTTVHIKGTCKNKDIQKLKKALDPGKNYENFHCLVCGGICGLPNWARESIDVVGNLAERDYSSNDVANQLKELSKIAPSLSVDIHCGGDYESKDCVNTIRLKNGKIKILPPQEKQIPEISLENMKANLLDQLMCK